MHHDVHAIARFQLAVDVIWLHQRIVKANLALLCYGGGEFLAAGKKLVRSYATIVIAIEGTDLLDLPHREGDNRLEFVRLEANGGDAQSDIVRAGRADQAEGDQHERPTGQKRLETSQVQAGAT